MRSRRFGADWVSLLKTKKVTKLFSELYKAWDESKHPRRKDGKFGTGNRGGNRRHSLGRHLAHR
jgi:hypothetical protein